MSFWRRLKLINFTMRYNGRILFIKDVIGDEICCWSFYGQSRKLAEVCCTSILYATEKKQTKVPPNSLCLKRAQWNICFSASHWRGGGKPPT
jgi:hypothetical protein